LPYLYLLILTALICLLNFFWLKGNFTPPNSDANAHLMFSIDFWELIFSQESLFSKINHAILFSTGAYPPLLYWTSFWFFRFFGLSIQTAIMSQSLFIIIFIFFIYHIGKLIRDEATGLIMAVVGASAPLFIIYSRTFFLDFSLLAIFTASYYFLLACRNYRNRKASIWLGIFLALGMLAKWSLAYFMFLPLALTALPVFLKGPKNLGGKMILIFSVLLALMAGLFFSLKGATFIALVPYVLLMLGLGKMTFSWSNNRDNPGFWAINPEYRDSFINLLWSIFTFLLICGGWYFTYSAQIFDRLFYQVDLINGYMPLSARLFLNFSALFFTYPFSFGFFLTGLAFTLFDHEARNKNWMTLLNLIFSFGLIAYSLPFDARYILPAYPLVLIISLSWIKRLKSFFPFLAGFLILVSLFQVNGWWLLERKFIPPRLLPELRIISVENSGQEDVKNWVKSNLFPSLTAYPDSTRYPIEEMLDLIAAKTKGRAIFIGIFNNLDAAPFQGRSIFLACRTKKMHNIHFLSLEDPLEKIEPNKIQFIIMLSNQESDLIKWRHQGEKLLKEKLKLTKEYLLNDKYKIQILQRASIP